MPSHTVGLSYRAWSSEVGKASPMGKEPTEVGRLHRKLGQDMQDRSAEANLAVGREQLDLMTGNGRL